MYKWLQRYTFSLENVWKIRKMRIKKKKVAEKFGAMIGDNVEVGCGSVLNPGTVIGRQSNIYPLSSVRGVVPAHSIYKKQGEVVKKHED